MWQEGADLSLDELVAFITASGPGTLPVSGVGGPPDKHSRVCKCACMCVRVCVFEYVHVCVSRPSGLKLLLNARPRNDTDMEPSCPSQNESPGKTCFVPPPLPPPFSSSSSPSFSSSSPPLLPSPPESPCLTSGELPSPPPPLGASFCGLDDCV